jgi:hypothetical protein
MDSESGRALLKSLIEEVTASDARRYRVTDDLGREMHCAKIVADPHAAATDSDTAASNATATTSSGRYLAVYHSTLVDGRFHSALATSTDLLTWQYVRDFGPGSSQPTIAVVPGSGGYLVAWEQDPDSHIALRYFPDRHTLFGGPPLREFNARRRTLSRCAEGTPNVYSVLLNPDIDHSVITLGGHYWWRCDRDRQLMATLTNFKRWHVVRRPELDDALLRWSVGGNIGGRDPISFFDHSYAVIEAQHVKGDFGSWRTYVYDYAAREAEPTAIRTDGGSTAFANPHVTALTAPDGRRALAVSLFVPSEGAAPGEAGQLIYYRTY